MYKLALIILGCFASSPAWALEDLEIPTEAPQDAVMATPAEVQQMHDWVAAALLGREPVGRVREVKLVCRRQDHSVLRFSQSCMETPIKIGQQEFKRGLGTHANSEILVSFPPGAKAFKAQVGIDNNYDTRGMHGSVQFSVERGGKEVFRTETLRGGNEPFAVSIELPQEASQLVLKVDTTKDGPAHDQADWADAHLVMGDGRILWLDDQDEPPFLAPAVPIWTLAWCWPSAAASATTRL